MTRLCLVRDVLDKQLLDASNQNAGKCDGSVLDAAIAAPFLAYRARLRCARFSIDRLLWSAHETT